LKLVQQKLGLRMLSHHKLGRHSVASQAVTSGESVKAVQAQLGHRSEQSTHKYSHLGSGAQRRIVEALKPATGPHETTSPAAPVDAMSTSHVNVRSTAHENGSRGEAHVNVRSTDTHEQFEASY